MSTPVPGLAHRSLTRLQADGSRVVTQLFVPGQEGFDHQESRSSTVIDRVLALDEDEATQAFDDVVARFDGRHHGLRQTFEQHADELADRLDPDQFLSPIRRLPRLQRIMRPKRLLNPLRPLRWGPLKGSSREA